MIAIVDYGLGNLGSIYNMIKKIGYSEVIYATTKDDIIRADKFILPGVGAFDTGMQFLNQSGMREELDLQVLVNNKPILGICLGMQMLGKSSQEGNSSGLGYIPFKCKKFEFDDNSLRIPHMGWDYVEINRDNKLLKVTQGKDRFYFVHSYYAVCEREEDSLMTCDYGINFTAAVNHNNIYGVQFHPEKSHRFGMELLKNFVEEI